MFVKGRSCAQLLPNGVARCQFCGAALAVAPGTRAIWHDDSDLRPYGRPGWVGPVYIAVCLYFLLSGLVRAGLALAGKHHGFDAPFVFVGPVINMILGIGLLARIEIIRGITNFICAINILFSLLGLLTGAVITMALGWIGLVLLFFNVLDIALNGFMIYLIGETD